MNNDLISREALKKAIFELPNDNPSYYYTGDLLDRERVLDEIDNAPTINPERTQGESFSLEDGLKKARRGNYVIYDVDFLLDNLAREVNIMESARQWKAGKGNNNE